MVEWLLVVSEKDQMSWWAKSRENFMVGEGDLGQQLFKLRQLKGEGL